MEINNKARTAILCGGAAALLAALGLNDYLWLRDVVSRDGTLTSHSSSPSSVSASHSQAAQTIVGRSLFGVLVSDVPPEIPAELPETTLVLILRGVAASTDEGLSSAMIEKPDGTTINVFVGSEIDPETTVHAIQSTQVVLKRRNQLEVLAFPDEPVQVLAYERPSRRSNAAIAAASQGTNAATSLSRTVTGSTANTSTGVLEIREPPSPPTAAERQRERDQEQLLERLNSIRNAGSTP
jgi:type II secretory pathway component PulC